MNNLPNEILDCVFANLNFFQKQECMLVCRRWSNIIRSTSLFSTTFISTKDSFDSLIRIIGDDPSYRSQIQTLIVKESVELDLKKQQLLDYFPSLHYFQTGDFIIQWNTHFGKSTIFPKDLQTWMSQTEIIEYHSQLRQNDRDLLSGVYPGLTKLSVNYFKFPFTSDGIVSCAPNINSLAIIEAMISLKDLERFNIGLKSLESLTLDKVILIDNGQLNGAIPENSLRTLAINFHYSTDDLIIKWLQYISNSYLQLANFKFVFPWTTNISLLQEENITNRGLIPLLQNIGDQLQRLDISCSNGVRPVLQHLSALKNVIPMLHLYTMISSLRKPLLYLGELGSFINQLTVTLNSTFRLKEYNLKELKMLKKLKIGCMTHVLSGHLSLSLDDLLDSCPDLLDSLEIYDFNVNCSNTSCRSHSLKKLAISSDNIYPSVYPFICDYLPNLTHLTFDQRSNFNIVDIVLKSKDLDYLEISMMENLLLLVNILSDRILHYYRVGNYKSYDFDSTELNSIRSYNPIKWTTPEKNPDSERTIELICNSVRTLVINNQLAF